MQSPITFLPPFSADILVTTGADGGWGGLVLTGTSGSPCTVQVSTDGLSFSPAAFPLALAVGTTLRLNAPANPAQPTLACTIHALSGGADPFQHSRPVSLPSGQNLEVPVTFAAPVVGLTLTATTTDGFLYMYLLEVLPDGTRSYLYATGTNAPVGPPASVLYPRIPAGDYIVVVEGQNSVNTGQLDINWEADRPLPTEQLSTADGQNHLPNPPAGATVAQHVYSGDKGKKWDGTNALTTIYPPRFDLVSGSAMATKGIAYVTNFVLIADITYYVPPT